MPTAYILQLAGACLLNAIVTCGVMQLALKRLVKSDIRYVLTFVAYFAMCYVATSGGSGLVGVGQVAIDTLRLSLYAFSGIAVCIVLYVINRYNKKNTEIYGEAAMKAARKRKK
ncbi:hypothetical protein LJB77_00915 [Ruminococcaceae bacterium OttesenSCG-928-N02]|nr:hypothetical protein [Ruminococcaceae bacterium OttesenSCG-928-N02]